MTRVNLKSMYNDPSQMREALAWRLFGASGVPAARHTYAKLAFDATYYGLFSVIEQVDKRFLADHFGENDRGNLYKAYCGDVGCATLEHRTGSGGDDSGRQYYREADEDRRTYRLKACGDDQEAGAYDDLAQFIRVINGVGLPGGDGRFGTDAFRASVDAIMNAPAFLRWASVNLLLGSWDNYYATPSNYYLYNSGRAGAGRDVRNAPYFTFIPWDYDNCLGIDYFGTQWQYTDILDWPQQHRGLLAAPRPVAHPAGAEPAAERALPRLLPGPPGVPARHAVQSRRLRGPDRARFRRRPVGPCPPGRLPGIGHPLRRAVHRPPVHQRRGLPGRLPAERAAPRAGKGRRHRELRPDALRPGPPAARRDPEDHPARGRRLSRHHGTAARRGRPARDQEARDGGHAHPGAQLELVTEAKVFDILEGVLSPRLEASGVLAKDGMFYVIFDNLPHIARIDPAISAAAEGNSIIWQDQGHRSGFEDIAHDPWNGRYYVLIESLPRGRRRYMAKVQEYDAGFGYTGQAWLDFPLDRPNKGIEGLACVRRQGQTYLLGLCEGNRCRGGAEGRIPGGGRVHVFRPGPHQWERLATIRLPETVLFEDYSGIAVSGDRVAVISQVTSALWIGRLDPARWEVTDAGTTYLLPRNIDGEIIYGTAEGVSWIAPDHLVMVSDKAKPEQPRRCRPRTSRSTSSASRPGPGLLNRPGQSSRTGLAGSLAAAGPGTAERAWPGASPRREPGPDELGQVGQAREISSAFSDSTFSQ